MENVLGKGGPVFEVLGRVARSLAFSHALKLFFLGAAVGWLAWGSGDTVVQLFWILILPFAWGRAESRLAASALMAGS